MAPVWGVSTAPEPKPVAGWERMTAVPQVAPARAVSGMPEQVTAVLQVARPQAVSAVPEQAPVPEQTPVPERMAAAGPLPAVRPVPAAGLVDRHRRRRS